MAPPTIAPPISPAAAPAATPRCALAGVVASEPAIVATATKAANVFFMSWALLEMAPLRAPGLRGLITPCSKLVVSPKSGQQSIQGNVPLGYWTGKKGFFGPTFRYSPKRRRFGGN